MSSPGYCAFSTPTRRSRSARSNLRKSVGAGCPFLARRRAREGRAHRYDGPVAIQACATSHATGSPSGKPDLRDAQGCSEAHVARAQSSRRGRCTGIRTHRGLRPSAARGDPQQHRGHRRSTTQQAREDARGKYRPCWVRHGRLVSAIERSGVVWTGDPARLQEHPQEHTLKWVEHVGDAEHGLAGDEEDDGYGRELEDTGHAAAIANDQRPQPHHASGPEYAKAEERVDIEAVRGLCRGLALDAPLQGRPCRESDEDVLRRAMCLDERPPARSPPAQCTVRTPSSLDGLLERARRSGSRQDTRRDQEYCARGEGRCSLVDTDRFASPSGYATVPTKSATIQMVRTGGG